MSGLFSFDKYSSLPLLIDAVREDVRGSGGSDANRRLFLVPLAHVIKLHTANGIVHTVEVDIAGQRTSLAIQQGCAVILAASGVESTRLALHSFPSPLMGRNLMAHVRSDFTVPIRRSALPAIPGHVQTAALLVRGAAPTGRFHLQVTASTSRAGSDELLFRMIPDLDLLDQQLANTDPDWITMTLRGIGRRTATPPPRLPTRPPAGSTSVLRRPTSSAFPEPTFTSRWSHPTPRPGRPWTGPHSTLRKRSPAHPPIFSICTTGDGSHSHFP